MSPTTIFSLGHDRAAVLTTGMAARWCTRGGADGWVVGGAIPGYYPPTLPVPIFSIYLRLSPTHGQMKAFSGVSMRFPNKGLELTRIDPELTPE